jgi:GH18 family chitinase
MVSLLQVTRQALNDYATKNASGGKMLLTVASPAGKVNYSKMKLKAMDAYLDFWNLMAYDYAGAGFSNNAGHQANFNPSTSNPASTDFNTASALKDYMAVRPRLCQHRRPRKALQRRWHRYLGSRRVRLQGAPAAWRRGEERPRHRG